MWPNRGFRFDFDRRVWTDICRIVSRNVAYSVIPDTGWSGLLFSINILVK